MVAQPVSIRSQIALHLVEVAKNSRLNRGGAHYGQVINPERMTYPYDCVTIGADIYEHEYNRREETATRFVVVRYYQYGFDGEGHEIFGDECLVDLKQHYAIDEENRHNDANRSLDFNVEQLEGAHQPIPEGDNLAIAALALEVTYATNELNPYSQHVD